MRPWVEVSPLSAVPGIYSAFLWNNVGFTLWFGPATLESLRSYEAACRDCIAAQPGKLSSVHILVPGSSQLPSPEVRAKLAELTREFGHTSAAMAVMIPGNGFWASALRGLVTAIHLVGSREYETKIFGTIEEIAAWLPEAQRKRSGIEISSAQLLTALRQVLREAESVAA